MSARGAVVGLLVAVWLGAGVGPGTGGGFRPGPAPAAAQAVAGGTAEDPGPLFDGRDAWIAGSYAAVAAAAFPFDERIARAVRDSVFQETRGLKEVSRGLDLLGGPGAFVLSGGLYGVGRLGGFDDVADVGLHMGEALAIATAFTGVLKIVLGRARPARSFDDHLDFGFGRGLRDSEYRSFPSGHATAAFAVAAVAAHEADRLWGADPALVGVLTYGPASLVALSRLFDNRHWASDVVFGAAIGAFSGWKVVRYSHSHPDNPIDDFFLAGSIVPGDWSSVRLVLLPVR